MGTESQIMQDGNGYLIMLNLFAVLADSFYRLMCKCF
jgi:hypothetical protein